MSTSVVLFRSPTGEKLRVPQKIRVLFCPAFRVRKLKISAASLKRSYDFAFFASVHAVHSLPSLPSARCFVAIGAKTAEALKRRGAPSPVALTESHQKGAQDFFKKHYRRSQNPVIFFPRSQRGDPRLVGALRKIGYRVHLRHTYTTDFLNLRAKLSRLLKKKPKAFLITSPSVFQALRKCFRLSELRKMPVTWLALGPTTASFLRDQGLRPEVSRTQSVEALFELASSL